MAVSLAQLSQGTAWRNRAVTTGSMANWQVWPQDGLMYLPMPERFHQTPQVHETPSPQHYGPYGYRPHSTHWDPYAPALEQTQSARYSQSYFPPWHLPPVYQEEAPPPPPPRPPKAPIELVPDTPQVPQQPPQSSQTRTLLKSDGASESSPSSSIEPDPLPPHSNPQALTPTQSRAFENSEPIPPVRLGKDKVYDSTTGFEMFTISRDAAHMPSFLSSKPILSLIRTSSGTRMGSIRFHKMFTYDIDLTINGRKTSISHSGLIHDRWVFESTTCPNAKEVWYWKKDKFTGGAKLEDKAKHGVVLARMTGELLRFEKGRLSEASYDEVLVSAVAMAEAARRQKKGNEVGDLAKAIGDFTSSSGDGGGDGASGGV